MPSYRFRASADPIAVGINMSSTRLWTSHTYLWVHSNLCKGRSRRQHARLRTIVSNLLLIVLREQRTGGALDTIAGARTKWRQGRS